MNNSSERIIAAAAVEIIARDVAGRSISVRQIGALDRLRLFKAIGALLSENPPYLGMAILAISVTAIDGVPVPPPITEAQIEALVARLGDEGITAIAQALDVVDMQQSELTKPGN